MSLITTVPGHVVHKEKEILKEQIIASGKKDSKFMEKIVQGKLDKFYDANVFSDQVFLIGGDEDSIKVSDLLVKKSAEFSLSYPLELEGFLRFQVGESTGTNAAEGAK